jgi:DNA-binding transcriptional LysR family regulator
MDVKDLRYFVAVYETGTFSRASECLATVQSNVSARIRALEDALGGALFERHYRGVVPTLKGQELYARAKDLIATFETTERAVKVAVIRTANTAAATGGQGLGKVADASTG